MKCLFVNFVGQTDKLIEMIKYKRNSKIYLKFIMVKRTKAFRQHSGWLIDEVRYTLLILCVRHGKQESSVGVKSYLITS